MKVFEKNYIAFKNIHIQWIKYFFNNYRILEDKESFKYIAAYLNVLSNEVLRDDIIVINLF